MPPAPAASTLPMYRRLGAAGCFARGPAMTMIPNPHTVPHTTPMPMPVPSAPPTLALPPETATRCAIAWSESLRDEAALNLPDDIIAVLEAGLPAAIAKAREDLEPVEPEEVVMALQAWADRRNLPLPEGLIPMPESFDLSLMIDSVGKGRFSIPFHRSELIGSG